MSTWPDDNLDDLPQHEEKEAAPKGFFDVMRLVAEPDAVGARLIGMDQAYDETTSLPSHLVEIHMFGRPDLAEAFGDGVRAGGSNSVAVSAPCGPKNGAVLLARFSETLEPGDQPPLIVHGDNASGDMLNELIDRVAADIIGRNHDRQRQARVDAWSDIQAFTDKMPRLYGRPIASGNIENTPLPNPGWWLRGTFDPGNSEASEHLVHVSRRPDKSIWAELHIHPLGTPVRYTPNSFPWVAEEARAAALDHGWVIDERSMAPSWRGMLDAQGEASFNAALLKLPKLVERLSSLSDKAALLRRVDRLTDEARTTLEALNADPKARLFSIGFEGRDGVELHVGKTVTVLPQEVYTVLDSVMVLWAADKDKDWSKKHCYQISDKGRELITKGFPAMAEALRIKAATAEPKISEPLIKPAKRARAKTPSP